MEKARISRLIDSVDLDEMHMTMAETVYGPALAAARTVDEVELALEDRLAGAYELAEAPGLPWQLGRFFRSRHDFNNMRALLKSGFGQELDVRLSDLGVVSADEAQTYAHTRSLGTLPLFLRTAVYHAVDAYERSGDLESIDVELDQSYYEGLSKLAAELRSSWINGYTRLLIDTANGRIVVRAREKGMPVKHVRRLLIPGGNIRTTTWREWLEGKTETPSGMVNEPLRLWLSEGGRLEGYDAAAEEALGLLLRETRVISAGPEPIFAYIKNVENEVRAVRTVMIGRISGVKPAVLRERLVVGL